MFRRRWSGLPDDPVFPADLAELGYFVNSDDEVRSIKDPKKYFKFFISKNQRWNERQRFAMNEAIEKLIHARLEGLGMQKLRLPLGAGPTDPHVPIFTSSNLDAFSRVVLIFGEPAQDLGVIAHRVAAGRGGVDAGSMVSVVRAAMGGGGDGAAGVVLANTGQLWWWPEGGRALTHAGRHAVPMASAVHWGRLDDRGRNAVPGNETPAQHVRYVFEKVVRGMAAAGARLDVIAVGGAADEVEAYLDDEEAWGVWGGRMNSLALLGGFYKATDLKCEGFKTFMRERARAYIIHDDPLNYPVAGSEGNPSAVAFTEFGCPVFSAGDAQIVELLLIVVHPVVLEWMQEVAQTENYKNPHIEVASLASADVEAGESWKAPEYKEEVGPEVEGRNCGAGEPAMDTHNEPSAGDSNAHNAAESKDMGDKSAEEVGKVLAAVGEPTTKPEAAAEGVPAEMKAEVLAVLGSMEKFASLRLEEGEERDEEED